MKKRDVGLAFLWGRNRPRSFLPLCAGVIYLSELIPSQGEQQWELVTEPGIDQCRFYFAPASLPTVVNELAALSIRAKLV